MCDEVAFQAETRDRLVRLEREVRRWRLAALVILPMACVLFLGAMAAPAVDELRTHTLRIVDKAGTDRLVLTAEPGVPDMTFLDPTGKSRLMLDIADDKSPVFSISDQGHESGRMVFSLGNTGLPELHLSAGPSKRSVTLGIPSAGGAVLRVLDEQGKLLMRVP
ncbi:MAG: hypothetical protein P4L84_14615 [Isosphaeraceae bacterium]|nr:hypothetical protein [Isosphaeraceae bacterium]